MIYNAYTTSCRYQRLFAERDRELAAIPKLPPRRQAPGWRDRYDRLTSLCLRLAARL